MKRLIKLFLLIAGCCFSAAAQPVMPADTIRLSREQAEAMFLQNNVLLLAEKLNISQAEALVMQARLWPNPTLSIDEVNLWATEKQLSYFGEELPPLIGNRGRHQQISVQLEQVVLTAGKRRKLVALEQVSADIAKQYYQDLLRNLKVEFRNSLTQLQYLQRFQLTYSSQLASVQSLVRAYGNQVERGNIGKGEYIRLKAVELELLRELNELAKENNEAQRELKVLLNLPPAAVLVLEAGEQAPLQNRIANLRADRLQELALDNRPDLKVAQLEESYYKRSLAYEKSLRVPDLALSGSYDRGGNFMLNFIGFGVAMDLPVFNRNQGNIRHARLGIDRTRLLAEGKANAVQAEAMEAYRNLLAANRFYLSIEPDYERDLDLLLESYTRNFRSRNISMLEYLDFFQAYLENKKSILESVRDLHRHFEELQYITGTELE